MTKKTFNALELQQKINEVDNKAEQTYVDEKVNTINSSLANCVTKVSGKGLSTNDFTNAYKTILDGLTATINTAINTAISNNNKKIYPIGHRIITENSNNPSTYLGFGTWKLTSKGKMMVGIDTTDADFNTVGKTGGSKTHTNTVQELAPHVHAQVVTNGVGGGINGRADYVEDGNSLNAYPQGCNTDSAGGGQAYSIMNPYEVVYIWVRTA